MIQLAQDTWSIFLNVFWLRGSPLGSSDQWLLERASDRVGKFHPSWCNSLPEAFEVSQYYCISCLATSPSHSSSSGSWSLVSGKVLWAFPTLSYPRRKLPKVSGERMTR